MRWRVQFSVDDRVRIAAAATERRREYDASIGTQHVPDTDQQRVDLVGIAGEWAFYKAVFGLDWIEPGWCANDVNIGDCRIDVKATWRDDGNLLVTPSGCQQAECDVYVLVRVDEDITEATMVGWQYSSKVRKAEFLTKLRSWVFLYPAEKLEPMETLLEVG